MKRFVFVLALLFIVSFVVYKIWDLDRLDQQKALNFLTKQEILDQISKQEELDKLDIKSEFLFPWQEKNISSIEEPTVTSMISYKEVVTTPQWEEKGEIDRRFDEKEKFWIATIKGFAHSFGFLDFGIIVGMEDPYETFFVEEYPKDIFRSYKDDKYDVIYKNQGENKKIIYIQKFIKDKDLDNIVFFGNNNDFIIERLDLENSPWFSIEIPDNHKIYMLYPDTVSLQDGNDNINYLVYNPDSPAYYYMISVPDGCAPSCGIPSYFEIL